MWKRRVFIRFDLLFTCKIRWKTFRKRRFLKNPAQGEKFLKQDLFICRRIRENGKDGRDKTKRKRSIKNSRSHHAQRSYFDRFQSRSENAYVGTKERFEKRF